MDSKGYTHTIENYANFKKEGNEAHVTALKNLEETVLSEMSQRQAGK